MVYMHIYMAAPFLSNLDPNIFLIFLDLNLYICKTKLFIGFDLVKEVGMR